MRSSLADTPEQQFFNAIMHGKITKLTELIKQGVSINTKVPWGGKQALHIACEAQQAAVVKKLIELGANVNATTDRGFTPLHVAAQQGNTECIIALIKAGALINRVCGEEGTTPLQEAANQGHVKTITILIAAGANAGYKEKKYGLTASDLAKLAKKDEAVIALLGYQKAFIQRVKNILENGDVYEHVIPPTPQYAYFLELKNVSTELDADEYFKAIKICQKLL